MVKPKWLALLSGALFVVVLFLLLGRWQLNAAFEASTTAVDSESYTDVIALGELIEPGGVVTEETVARSVTMSGWLVPGDFTIVSNRVQDGDTGWWVVGHLAVANDGITEFQSEAPEITEEVEPNAASGYPGLAVAIGWAATEAEALAAVDSLNASTPEIAEQSEPMTFTGKLEALQEPVIDRDGSDPFAVNSMSVGQLINTWQAPAVSYYSAWGLIEEGAELPAGLQPISVVAIDDSFQLDLLNIFYAIEWLVFAGMAIYIWWRLVRDDYLSEQAQDPIADLAEEIRREKLRQIAANASKTTSASSTSPERN